MDERRFVVFVAPDKVNLVLTEIAEVKGWVMVIAPFTLHDYPGGQVVMIDFAVETECEAAAALGLVWLEDTLGPNCIVF